VHTVEFYQNKSGREPVRDYYLGLSSTAERLSIYGHILLLREFGWRLPQMGGQHARLIDKESRIYELRAGKHRIAYAQYQGRFVLLHAWRKSSQKLDIAEAHIARNRLAAWLGR